jgi:lipopolysaccharide export system protein LptA
MYFEALLSQNANLAGLFLENRQQIKIFAKGLEIKQTEQLGHFEQL